MIRNFHLPRIFIHILKDQSKLNAKEFLEFRIDNWKGNLESVEVRVFFMVFAPPKKKRFTTASALRGIAFAPHDAGEHSLTP